MSGLPANSCVNGLEFTQVLVAESSQNTEGF